VPLWLCICCFVLVEQTNREKALVHALHFRERFIDSLIWEGSVSLLIILLSFFSAPAHADELRDYCWSRFSGETEKACYEAGSVEVAKRCWQRYSGDAMIRCFRTRDGGSGSPGDVRQYCWSRFSGEDEKACYRAGSVAVIQHCWSRYSGEDMRACFGCSTVEKVQYCWRRYSGQAMRDCWNRNGR
jgi:hypothetical protein